MTVTRRELLKGAAALGVLGGSHRSGSRSGASTSSSAAPKHRFRREEA
jgi:hypothetical protein